MAGLANLDTKGFQKLSSVLPSSTTSALLVHINNLHQIVLSSAKQATKTILRQKLRNIFPPTISDSKVDRVLEEHHGELREDMDLEELVCAVWDLGDSPFTPPSNLPPFLDHAKLLGPIHSRSNRWDLKLSLTSSIVAKSLTLALAATHEFITAQLGPSPELVELSSLISVPGAGRQPLHSDTAYSPSPSIITCFVLLQDVNCAMGPTTFIERTHNDEKIHRSLGKELGSNDHLLDRDSSNSNSNSNDNNNDNDNNNAIVIVEGVGNDGDCFLMDSRTLHAGGRNDEEAGSRRVLFYFSFRRSASASGGGVGKAGDIGDYGSTYSLLEEFRGSYFLSAEGELLKN